MWGSGQRLEYVEHWCRAGQGGVGAEVSHLRRSSYWVCRERSLSSLAARACEAWLRNCPTCSLRLSACPAVPRTSTSTASFCPLSDASSLCTCAQPQHLLSAHDPMMVSSITDILLVCVLGSSQIDIKLNHCHCQTSNMLVTTPRVTEAAVKHACCVHRQDRSSASLGASGEDGEEELEF